MPTYVIIKAGFTLGRSKQEMKPPSKVLYWYKNAPIPYLQSLQMTSTGSQRPDSLKVTAGRPTVATVEPQ